MSSHKTEEKNKVTAMPDFSKTGPKRPDVPQMDYRQPPSEDIDEETKKGISQALDNTLLGTPKESNADNDIEEDNQTTKKITIKKSTKTEQSSDTDSESIIQSFKLPIDLNYELLARSKQADFREYKITKAELIAIACRYFLDNYKTKKIDPAFLELVGKSE